MKRSVLSRVFGFCVLFCFVYSCATVTIAQESADPFKNQFNELRFTLTAMETSHGMKEFELSPEQTILINRARRRIEDQYQQYHDNIGDHRSITPLPVDRKVYSQRFAEDIKIVQQQLMSDILLPHQVELLDKFQRKVLLQWHLNSDFRRTKGTRFEGLNISDKQRKRFGEIKQKFRDDHAKEHERFQAAIQKLNAEQAVQILDEMTDEQRELLNIK